MSVRDIFALIVRLAGLGLAVFGVLDVLGVLATIAGIPTGYNYPVASMALAAAIYLVVGLALLVAAKSITCLVYGRE